MGPGLASPANFRVLMTGGILQSSAAKALAFLCNQAVLPGKALMTNEIRTYGPIRKAPYRIMYDDLQLSFYCGEDMRTRDIFNDWQEQVVSSRTGQVNYHDTYAMNIEIEQFDKKGKTTYACKIEDAFPVIVAPLALDWSQRDSFHNLSVTFAYRKWYKQPLSLFPFGNNVAINSLYPNFDINGALDEFKVAAVGRADGQLLTTWNNAGTFGRNVGQLFSS
tara:strand:+ start:43137 stop:43799 length:663 start_codon:yes stop_codon:yes gene_type:complete